MLIATEAFDRHKAGTGGKVFLSGLLTLGASAVESKLTLNSEMSLQAVRWDGVTKIYKTKTSVTASYNMSTSDAAQNRVLFQDAYNKVCIRATSENFRSLVSQLVADSAFLVSE